MIGALAMARDISDLHVAFGAVRATPDLGANVAKIVEVRSSKKNRSEYTARLFGAPARVASTSNTSPTLRRDDEIRT